MKGKLVIIEGTDCSGKETQSNKLFEKLKNDKVKVFKYSFPSYDTPSGKIVGGPYLGKSYICDGWFKEKAPNVDALVASLYYAADRRYNKDEIIKRLNEGYIVIIDRYVESNMAHQGGKIKDKEERLKMYKKLELLEYEILELPKPDLVMFLYLPYFYANILKQQRNESLDQHESSLEHLKNAEDTYLELAEKYNFTKIDCVKNDEIRSIDDISEECYQIVRKLIKKEE